MKKTCIFLMFVLISACGQSKKEQTTAVNELPAITLTMTSGQLVKATSLPGNSILIFFGPDCEHCQREAEAIRKNITEFKNYSLYFIAPYEHGEIKKFAVKYDLDGFPNILFASAVVAEVVSVIGPMDTPTIFVYSFEKKLVKRFNGETEVGEIVKVL